MSEYRRYYQPGGCFFFTLVTEGRAPILTTAHGRSALREAILKAKSRWPFGMPAVVLLPDHIHAIWNLPRGDADFSTRWAFIKQAFTRSWLRNDGAERAVSAAKARDRRRGVWQRRFWEHVIRDEVDLERHADYLHYNPAKHGLVRCPMDWPYSSFHRWVRQGDYPPDWGCAGRSRPTLRFDDLNETAME